MQQQPDSRPSGLSVRTKLIGLAVGTAVLALLLACAAFVYYDRVSFSEAKRSTLSVLVESVSQSAFGPTAFQDGDSASVILKVLESEPSAQGGAVYLDDGSRLASWYRERSGVTLPAKLGEIRHEQGFHGDQLFVTRKVGNAEQTVGTLHVIFSASDIAARTARFLQIAAGVLLVSALGALVLAWFAQRVLTRPVEILAEAAHSVQEHKNFDVRAKRVSNDELGRLTDAFNDMLSMIQARDQELEGHRTRLEVLVAERTRDLDQRNAEMRLVLDNVDQGMLIVDRDGRIGPERSAIIDQWFGPPALDQPLDDYMRKVSSAFSAKLGMAWEQLLEGFLPLELNLAQLPAHIHTSADKHFELCYRPIGSGADDHFDKLLVIISDVTARVEKERSDAEQAQIIAMFEHVTGDRNGFIDFFEETEQTLERLTGSQVRDRVVEMRELHTLKGNFGLFGLKLMAKLIHEIEDECLEAGRGPDPEQRARIRVAWERVASRARTLLGDGALSMTVGRKDVEELLESIRAGSSQAELAHRTARLLLDPVAPKLSRIGERARTLAERLGKSPIDVTVEAEGVRAPGDIGWLWHVLPHVVANSVDHGLEAPAERQSSGKAGHPHLKLSAKELSRSLVIEVQDNGRGVDWDKVREKAQRLGLPSDTSEDLVRALFSDGVSTKDAASEVSGRGIGLSAVSSACQEHGASVQVNTTPGEGTVFRFTVANSNHARASMPPQRRSFVA